MKLKFDIIRINGVDHGTCPFRSWPIKFEAMEYGYCTLTGKTCRYAWKHLTVPRWCPLKKGGVKVEVCEHVTEERWDDATDLPDEEKP